MIKVWRVLFTCIVAQFSCDLSQAAVQEESKRQIPHGNSVIGPINVGKVLVREFAKYRYTLPTEFWLNRNTAFKRLDIILVDGGARGTQLYCTPYLITKLQGADGTTIIRLEKAEVLRTNVFMRSESDPTVAGKSARICFYFSVKKAKHYGGIGFEISVRWNTDGQYEVYSIRQ